ncbi:hypothetical protein KK137_00790 [Croceibacterium sp. LX-88]|jgi:hypothetical protein|uniref:Uncharacterized protein n=1 Tax=Croceibacterium selenioxidans TaxID=2838833 RepID=A0ABS5VZA5_9SPHN|nr:DUF6152 family protein [Croceibacterium selenioxidans]MBT2132857.1 hypothetical protein [Croceibacterium selenioxidans]
MNLKNLTRGLALLSFAVALPMPALAHHSFAMFDNSRSITLHGKVSKYQWTNPHAYLEVDADQPGGGTKHYTLEMTSINMMSRGGWTSRTVKTGDVVTVVVAPLRDGQAGGLVLEVTLPDGRKMLPGVPNAQNYKRTS